MPEPKCPRCRKPFSPNETIESDGYAMVHVDCGRPRCLSPEEYVFLYAYCWDHVIAECAACAQKFRQAEFGAEPFSAAAFLCPYCQADLTGTVRAHLLACSTLPDDLRRRVQEARERAGRLLKQGHQLLDHADLLRRELQAARAALRETVRQRPRRH